MFSLILSPPWFRGFDCIFEYFGVIVFLLIALFAYKATKITSDKKTKWLFISFLLIALSYFLKVFENLNLYFPVEKSISVGSVYIRYTSVAIVQSLFLIEFVTRILFLLGFISLYFLITRSEEKKHVFLLVYLITIVTYVSSLKPMIFHLTSAILIGEISYFYLKKTKLKTLGQKSMFLALVCLAMSNLLLLILSSGFYVSAMVLELIAFVFFMFAFANSLFGSRIKNLEKTKK